MNDLGPWNNEDFDKLSWHDVHVHGLRLDAIGEDVGVCDLVLDIDYLLQWKQLEGSFIFTVCQAVLRFQKVADFKIALDYASPTAAMSPFSIDGIERKPLIYANGYNSFHWLIAVNWPIGQMEFDAPGFTQTLIGSPSIQESQFLASDQRILLT